MGKMIMALGLVLIGYSSAEQTQVVELQKQAFEIKDNNGHYCKLGQSESTETGLKLVYDCNGREISVLRYRYEVEVKR